MFHLSSTMYKNNGLELDGLLLFHIIWADLSEVLILSLEFENREVIMKSARRCLTSTLTEYQKM